MSFGQAPQPNHNPNNDAEIPNAATDGISCVTWSPVSNHLIAGSWDSQVRCWEVQPNGTSAPKAGTPVGGPVLCASWSADGARAYVGSCDQKAYLWDLATNKTSQVAQHSQPVKNIFWVQEMNCCVTASWDKTIKYWDGKSSSPAATLTLPERAYATDVRYPLMVVATADKKMVVVNLTNPQTIFTSIASPLKLQSRCVACFPDQQGFCVGSIEGRVAVHHVQERNSRDNFAFKCHRDNNDIYAVDCITFHPQYGTFATTGSDGTFNFWDKDSRQRLKAFNKASLPIPCGAFNRDGSIFAYAVSYDWSRGQEHYTNRSNHLLLHSTPEAEIRSRNQVRSKTTRAPSATVPTEEVAPRPKPVSSPFAPPPLPPRHCRMSRQGADDDPA